MALVLSLIVHLMSACAVVGDETLSVRQHSSHDSASPRLNRCGQDDLSGTLQKLSSGNPADVEQARQVLLEYSERSEECKAEVISTLVSGMNTAAFDMNAADSNLWREGASLLGDMKATESLDFLISHLDLTGREFSTSMVHQPAVLGVPKMGPVALPKLRAALLTDNKPKIRLAAALCLTAIGGQDEVDTLRQSLRSETDQCVSDFVRVSLKLLADDSKSRSRASEQTSFTTDLVVRRELLSIFVKCN